MKRNAMVIRHVLGFGCVCALLALEANVWSQTPEAFSPYGLPYPLMGQSKDGIIIRVHYTGDNSRKQTEFSHVGLLNNSAIRKQLVLSEDQQKQFEEFHRELQSRIDREYGVISTAEWTQAVRKKINTTFEAIREEMVAKTNTIVLPNQILRLKQLYARDRGGIVKFIDQLRSPEISKRIDLTQRQDTELQETNKKLIKEMEADMKRIKLKYVNDLIKVLNEQQRQEVLEIFGRIFQR